MSDLRTSYIVSHGFDESGRLHLQQWLWNMQVGWDLHPAISFQTGNKPKIADHGCGNGAWLLSLDPKLKSSGTTSALVGLDVSPVHFPASANLPENIKLEVLDAFTDTIPEEHIGQYDVVHVRLFTGVVKNNNPAPLIHNAFQMLKPGSYLQWHEFDGGTGKGVAPGDDPTGSRTSIAATNELLVNALDSSLKAMGLEYSWIGNLGKNFQEHGLEVIEDKRMDVKKELRKVMTDSLLMALHHISRIAVRNGCLVGTDKNFQELWAKAGEEINQGVSFTMDMLVVVGRKPL
ncbi:UMTA methyltransferase family protein-like protein [Corynespora cassiicola Philippines]|uniref:UMTA methyltransferase family protein-like protein n=1 Tax=Corynespora cassiicola Philippines TaxID=1448308 RepID=A0A2T2NBI6_CORCC|nr:UMTA methyltransferase family protein-like protein [Corynespora cassiicola Philippines]